VIIDFHTHIVAPDVIARREHYLARDHWFGQLYESPRARLVTAEGLISSMDQSGVDRAVTFGFSWADAGLLRANNDYVFDAARRYPDRLIPFTCINPQDKTFCISEIGRCVDLGARGIGELMPDAQGYDLDDQRRMAPIIEVAVQRGLILLTHTSESLGHVYQGKGETTPDKVVGFAELFPDATLVCAHWGGGLLFYELMPELMITLRNVYYDTAATHYLYRDKIMRLALELMPHKVLWATDYPLISQQYSLSRLEWSHLPADQYSMLVGGNAERLLAAPA
jgi:predicted TIM-barrel fold metal-dependent hydrolase